MGRWSTAGVLQQLIPSGGKCLIPNKLMHGAQGVLEQVLVSPDVPQHRGNPCGRVVVLEIVKHVKLQSELVFCSSDMHGDHGNISTMLMQLRSEPWASKAGTWMVHTTSDTCLLPGCPPARSRCLIGSSDTTSWLAFRTSANARVSLVTSNSTTGMDSWSKQS